MGLFVEVDSVEKRCKVVINLDTVQEIAPLFEGGCALFFTGSEVAGVKVPYKVKNSYDDFKQFAMQTVSSDDIANKVKALKTGAKIPTVPVAGV